jgi:hypothetical protein
MAFVDFVEKTLQTMNTLKIKYLLVCFIQNEFIEFHLYQRAVLLTSRVYTCQQNLMNIQNEQYVLDIMISKSLALFDFTVD